MTITVGARTAPATALTVVDGVLHALVAHGWSWPEGHEDLVGDARLLDPATEADLRLIGWWSWQSATRTLVLDLAAATVRVGHRVLELEDDDATTALFA